MAKTPAKDDHYQAPALKKGLEVLEFLSGQTEPHAVSELARALGKSRNEIYRMVIVLEQLGYLTRTETDRYAVSHKLFDVAMRAPPRRNLLAQALPVMEQLAQETSQSCHLVVASGTDMVVVARAESPEAHGFAVRIGYRRPLNQSASGRVLFAFQTDGTRAAWRNLERSQEERKRWDSIEEEVAMIRETGIYLSPSAYVDAVTDIAVPVTDRQGAIAIAALVMPYIGGRSARLSVSQATQATRRAAQRISGELA